MTRVHGRHRRPTAAAALLHALTPQHRCNYCERIRHCWTRSGLERHWGTHNGVRGATA